MDSQRDLRAPAGAAAFDSAGTQRDWLRLDLDRCAQGQPGADGFRVFSPAVVEDLARDALTSGRLLAWVERLRGGDGSLAAEASAETTDAIACAAVEQPVPADVPTGPAEPARGRGIPASALVAVGRASSEEPQARTAPPPLDPPAPELRLPRRRFRLRAVPSSPNVRFILLCLAAFFFAAGVAHSFARWKPARVIVVPASEDVRTMIT